MESKINWWAIGMSCLGGALIGLTSLNIVDCVLLVSGIILISLSMSFLVNK